MSIKIFTFTFIVITFFSCVEYEQECVQEYFDSSLCEEARDMKMDLNSVIIEFGETKIVKKLTVENLFRFVFRPPGKSIGLFSYNLNYRTVPLFDNNYFSIYSIFNISRKIEAPLDSTVSYYLEIRLGYRELSRREYFLSTEDFLGDEW